jgi:hypothetical protein
MSAAGPQAPRRSRRTLVLIALVAVAPVLASYAAYYWFPREKQVNYGELLPTAPAPEIAAAGFRLSDLRGKWVLVMAAPGACDAMCQSALYATRQARTIQGKEMERIARVWFATGDAKPGAALREQHPDLTVVPAPGGALSAWPAGADRIYLVDPLGNLVLAWHRDPDIKNVARDIGRLLKASRIG